MWYLLLQCLGSTIFPVWCWCQHRSLRLNQSLWTCIGSIQIQPWEYLFLLRSSWTSVVSSCIIILFASRPPASFLLLQLWSWSLLWGGMSLFQQTSSQPSRLETLRPAHCEQTSTFVSGRVSLVVKDSQFANSFINFVLHFHLHQHYSNITTVRNLLKLWFFLMKI